MNRYALLGLLVLLSVELSAQAPGCPAIDAGPDVNLTCNNNCANLTANIFDTGATTDYSVSSITYAPSPYTGGTQIFIGADDIWSGLIGLPFNFCFYGNQYNQLLIGANGVLTFDVSLANGGCQWFFTASIPTPGPPPGGIYNNSINGAYHDMDPSTFYSNPNINYLTLGTYPCRRFVVNYNKVDHYNCESTIFGTGTQTTQQIVLYETTNVIEVYIDNKPICSSWNGGRAVIGLQNATGTQGITPPGRNTGAWATSTEAWQFNPIGPSITSIKWYDPFGNVIGTNSTVSVCPSTTSTYTAEGIYNRCDGTQVLVQDDVSLFVANTISSTTSYTDETCLGVCDGEVSVYSTSGTPPITYNIGSGSQNSGLFSGLCAGNYTVTVTDGGGCTETHDFIIAPGANLSVSASKTNEVCLGAGDGTATLTASGGTGPYFYDIGTAVNNSGSFTGLSPNTYNYIVTDANNCTYTGSFTILPGTQVSASHNATNEVCAGANNGSVVISASGGTGPYSFNMGGQVNSTGIFSSLAANSYSYTVTDANNCTAVGNFTINPGAQVVVNVNKTDEECAGGNDGTATLNASGGSNPYNYNIGTQSNNNGNFSGLADNTYNYTVTDGNGCSTTGSFTINPGSLVTVNASKTNEVCQGANDGTATLSAAGGIGPYNYNIGTQNNTNGNFTGLAPNTYNYTVTDADGCTATGSFTISPGSIVSVSETATDEVCQGASDGTVAISASGGTAPYNYSIGAQNNSTGNFSNLAPNTYNYTVTDANNCSATGSFTISPGSLVSASETVTHEVCQGANDGTATISASGGTAPYTYNIGTQNNTTGSFTGLAPNTYNYTVTDANGCTTAGSFNINAGTLVTTTENTTDEVCSGANDGAATISVLSGTSPYTYDIGTQNNTTGSFTGLSANTYNYTVTDANSCTATGSFTIGAGVTVTVNETTTDEVCSGANDGTANITASGGTAPYTYDIGTQNNTSGNFTGLAPNTYNYTATDANGCVANGSFTINPGSLVTTNETTTDEVCAGAHDGTVAIAASGGTAPYTFSVGGQNNTTGNYTGLWPTTYNYTVTDVDGCTATGSFTINAGATVSTSETAADEVCQGANDGTATITATGGTAPYTYDIGTQNNTTGSFTGLAPNTYNYTVTDANNCSATGSFSINPGALVTSSESTTDEVCQGANDGTATISASGGTAPYTYDIGTQNNTTGSFTGLAPNTYNYTVTDANGCTATGSITIGVGAAILASEVTTDEICDGDDDGTVTITATGGTAPYTYDIGFQPNTYGDFIGLTPSTYNYTVTDANGCTTNGSFVINSGVLVTATHVVTDETCMDMEDGAITITATSGVAPYTYQISGLIINSTGIFTGLRATGYSYEVTDATGCIYQDVAVVYNGPLITASESSTDEVCAGANDGTTTITATGGTAPYTYDIGTQNNTTGSFTGLAPNTYNYTVTDVNGCNTTGSFTINPGAQVTSNETTTDEVCQGSNDGTATITVSGGTAPYSFDIGTQNNATGSFTGLAANIYNYTVTDANNCTASGSFTIGSGSQISLSEVTTDEVCQGANDGTVTLTASGGTAPYTFDIGGQNNTTGNFTGLSANTYNYTVTDADNCTASGSFTIGSGSLLSVSETTTDEICLGDNVGTATITATGGAGPYTFDIGTQNNTTGNFTGLAANTYNYTITDADNCAATGTFTINAGAQVTTSETTTDEVCSGDNDGAATITATGGTAPYTFDIGTQNNTTGSFTGLAPNTYNYTVTDANNCSGTGSFTINTGALVTTNETTTDEVCQGANDGTATITAAGGTAPYTYDIGTQNNTTGSFTGLAPNTYNFSVTDANGCAATGSFTINAGALVTTSETATDEVCQSANDGTATITASGGTAPYTFDIGTQNNTTGSFTGLAPNTYNYTVTDANNCSGTGSFTINAGALVTANETTTDEVCQGANDGTATITATGGTSPYTYDIGTQNNTTGNFTGLAANTYNYTVTDADGCTATGSFTINAGALVTTSETATDEICAGANDGTATITATGGTAPYTFDIGTQNNTTGSFTGLAPNTYNYTVTDANGCNATGSFNINVGSLVSASETTIDEVCSGANDGTATITATGGTTPYTFDIGTQNNTSGSFTGLAANTYNYTVTDADGCTATGSFTINAGTTIATSETTTAEVCLGSNDGTASITATGGTAPYTFDIGAQNNTTGSFTGLTANTYNYTVTDADGCVATGSFTINAGSSVTLSETVTDEICAGANDGAVSITAAGGNGPYTFDIGTQNNGTGNFTGLAATTYNYIVTDADNCAATGSFTVNPGAQVTTTETTTDEVCDGANDGAVTITATGGTAPHTFDIGTQNNTTGSFTGLAPNTYNYTVTDANNCMATGSFTINVGALVITSESTTDEVCAGANDGTATLTATGGTAPYTFDIGTQNNTTGSFTGLAPNTYNYTVTDANGCTATGSFTINPGALVTTGETTTDEVCAGANDGTATITATGGTAPYTFDIGTQNNTTGSFTGLAPNTYNYTVTDANNCTASGSFTINTGTTITTSEVTTAEVCQGSNDGTVTITATGGTSPYTFDIGTQNNTTGSFTGLAANTYNYTVTDANNCSTSGSFTIGSGSLLSVSATATDEICDGASDGTANISATGGNGPYTFDIGTQNNTNGSFTGLAPNTYNYTVTDADNCAATGTFAVNPGALVVTTETATDEVCAGANDGTATITATGGTTPYTFDIGTNNNTTGSFASLTPNTYNYTVTDANSCSASGSFTVNAGALVTASETTTDEVCAGANDGTATITASGGTAPYTYDIGTQNNTTGSFTGLAPNTYNYTVTDANNCMATGSFTINAGALITTSETTTDEVCLGANDGSATITATGGTSPYTFDIGTQNNTTGNFTGLTSNTYNYTVTDANNCTANSSFDIVAGATINVSATATDEVCDGADDGTAVISASGGAGPYTFDIGTQNNTTGSFSGLADNTYNYIVTDADNCGATGTFTVNQGTVVTAAASVTDESCKGYNDGSVTLTPNGGATPYAFDIGGGPNNVTGVFNNLAPNTYNFIVYDNDNCTASGTFAVSSGPVCCIMTNTVSSTDPVCAGSCDGTITLTESQGYAPVQFSIDNGNTFQPTGNFTGLCAGTYDILIEDAEGCSFTDQVVLTDPSLIVVTESISDASCNGTSDGSITLTLNGGTSPYSFVWSDNSTNQNLVNATSDNYTVEITDANGCTASGSYFVDEPDAINLTYTQQDVSCANGTDGSIDLSVSGGAGGFSFNWTGGLTSEDIANLTANTYDVVVTDANNCSATETVTLTQPAPLSLSQVISDATCREDNGRITLTASGGTGSYTYDWGSNGNASELADVAPGNYAVTVMDDNGCTITGGYTVGDSPVLDVDAGTNITIDKGDELQLSPSFSDPGLVGTIMWTPNDNMDCDDCERPIVNPDSSTSYTLNVIDVNGCPYTDDVFVTVYSRPILYIPNAFSPNGDGINDMFGVSGNEITSVHMIIYDRWGEKLLDSKSLNPVWDGTFRGEMKRPGVYVYYIVVQYTNFTQDSRQGSFTLLR